MGQYRVFRTIHSGFLLSAAPHRSIPFPAPLDIRGVLGQSRQGLRRGPAPRGSGGARRGGGDPVAAEPDGAAGAYEMYGWRHLVARPSALSPSKSSRCPRIPPSGRAAIRASIRRSAGTSASAQDLSIVDMPGRMTCLLRHSSTKRRTSSSPDWVASACQPGLHPVRAPGLPVNIRSPQISRRATRCSCRVWRRWRQGGDCPGAEARVRP